MDRLKQLKTYPFGLFLWLEWMFLGCVLGRIPSIYIGAEYRLGDRSITLVVAVSLFCLLALGLMGLNLPKKNSLRKWIYFGVQLALALIPTIFVREPGYAIYACLIIVVRNGLVFQQPKQRWLANILLFLSLIPCFTLIRDFQTFKSQVSRFQNIRVEEYEKIMTMSIISNLIETALCMALIWIIVNVVLREYKSQQQLAIAREQLRQYALQAEDRATVHERNRIAREIHDSVGHSLTAQSIQLHNAIAYWQSDPTKAHQFLLESQGLVKTALKDIRHSVSTLRSDPLQGKKLDSAISSLCHTFFGRTKVMPNFSLTLDRPLTEEIKLTVYRIVQEALTNMIKHSQPTAVNLEMQTFAHLLHLSIEDNGRGFNPQQNTTGFGLQGMSERVIALHGDINIDSSLGCGCKIAINIPLESS